VLVVAIAGGGVAAGLLRDEPRRDERPRQATPPREIDSESCLDHPADEPSDRLGAYGCEALTRNPDGTCTLESVTIENWRPVSVKRTIVRCP
jgi:hypothetical protein